MANRTHEKDYYQILGIENTSTPEQIKDAYRSLAKKHHPDVSSEEPDVEKFRNVVEAYQVLSVTESRATFDISRRKNPQMYKAMSDTQFDMVHRRDLRNKEGNISKTAPSRGSYAEQRIAELKKERKKYNVNDLGYYNGGVPRRNRASIRGEALGPSGEFHNPHTHNFLNNEHADMQRVTTQDAVQFKHFMGSDKADFLRTKPAYSMYYDTNFNYTKDRDFWFKFLLGWAFTSYAIQKV